MRKTFVKHYPSTFPPDVSKVSPTANGVLFQKIHVLAPTQQLAFYLQGQRQPPSYTLTFNSTPAIPGQSNPPFLHPQISFANVVFDDLPSGVQSPRFLQLAPN